MKNVKSIKITYWVFVVAALVLAADFAISIMHFNVLLSAKWTLVLDFAVICHV